MTKFHLLWIIITPFCYCNAQYSDQEVDSTGIISYADKFVVKVYANTQTDTYSLNNTENGNKLILASNNNYRLFVSLDYEFIGLSIGFAPTFFPGNNDDALKGESSFSDIRFRAALGHWIQGFQLGKIKGYYIENTEDFFPFWEEGTDPYLQIPTMTSKVFGMSTSYNFNPKFSFRNIFYQTEWQTKSAGSFIPSFFYNFNQLSYELGGQEAKEYSYPIRLAPAYYYTLVLHENWFVAGNLSPSMGIRFTKSTLTENKVRSVERYNSFIYALEGGLQLGYASRKVLFGAGFTFEMNGYNEDKTNAIVNDKIYGLLYFGYRFNAPGFIDRTYKKYAEKLGI